MVEYYALASNRSAEPVYQELGHRGPLHSTWGCGLSANVCRKFSLTLATVDMMGDWDRGSPRMVYMEGMLREIAWLQNLSTMIWGMARLAEHPGPGLIQKYLQKLNELLDTANFTADDRDQGIPNTLWALAVLDELHPDFVERVGCLHPL